MVSLCSHLAARGIRTGVTCALALLAWLPWSARAEDAADLLDAWLRSQTTLVTWSAEFTQTRTLKTLTQPLVSRGRLWFAAPNQFRWELGDPAQTIALRNPAEMLVIYPRLKRAERYPLAGAGSGPMRDMLALLEAGFPRSRVELESQFRLVRQETLAGVQELTLQPKSAAARRLMPQFKLAFSPADQGLRATELQFADGSTMRNDFTNAVRNPVLATNLFVPALGVDFTITQPGGK